jgi:hypothetical protein
VAEERRPLRKEAAEGSLVLGKGIGDFSRSGRVGRATVRVARGDWDFLERDRSRVEMAMGTRNPSTRWVLPDKKPGVEQYL